MSRSSERGVLACDGFLGVRDWRLLFPGSCRCLWRPGGRVKDRAAARPRSGAGGVLEASVRVPDDLAAGEWEPGPCEVWRLFRVVPWSGFIRCGQCRWLHSSLRVSPAGAGGHGAVRVREVSGGANQMDALPPGAGGRIACGLAPGGGQNAWRPRARAGVGHVHVAAAGVAGGLDRQRICPSRIP